MLTQTTSGTNSELDEFESLVIRNLRPFPLKELAWEDIESVLVMPVIKAQEGIALQIIKKYLQGKEECPTKAIEEVLRRARRNSVKDDWDD